jgi:Zn-dependent peptidase ImmA (M78 family)
VPKEDAAEAAKRLLARYGVQSVPVPVEQIAVACGIQVVRTAADWRESGFLLRDGHRTIIGINGKNSSRRQRFTIAHELGHYELHAGKPLIVDQSVMVNKRNDVSSEASDKEEIDANRFAAELLMPRTFVLAAVHRLLTGSVGSREELVATLARDFDVSSEAMGWRLVNLGISSS